jgi:1-phosphofructokinase family hexose kinase
VILCAGLTPAWQQIVVLDAFRCGEVNRAREVHWCTSGKVCNAGIALRHLGGPCRILSTVGGPPVSQIERELKALDVPYRWVLTRSETRICTTILDRATGTITELVENGRPLEPDELDAFRTAYAEEAAGAEVVVLIGSLPAQTPHSFYRELLLRTPCPAVLDFRGEGLLGVLDLKPYVVKPNREELARTVGRPLDTDDALLGAMRELNRRGAAWAVVTQGPGPVFVTSADGAWRLHPPPAAPLVNPIGSGDALAATIAWATRAGRPLLDAVRLGLAAAGQNVRQLLPCRLDPTALEGEAAAIRVETCGR